MLSRVSVRIFLIANRTYTHGSTVQLPDSAAIRQEFGCVSNQHGLVMPMGRISAAYDVENGLSLDAVIAPYTSQGCSIL